MKSYRHIGVNPLRFQTDSGEVVIAPGTDRFSVAIPPELEAFLTQIEAIQVLPAERERVRPIKVDKE